MAIVVKSYSPDAKETTIIALNDKQRFTVKDNQVKIVEGSVVVRVIGGKGHSTDIFVDGTLVMQSNGRRSAGNDNLIDVIGF